MVIKNVCRGDVYWVELDPTRGSEINKTRPCLIISANDMNRKLPRVLVAPITSKGQAPGCRPTTEFNKKSARILFDQIRSLDKLRLSKHMGQIDESICYSILLEM